MITYRLFGSKFKFETDRKLFSPYQIDSGTQAMLSQIKLNRTDKVLDLGCGYGVVGITIAAVIGEEHVVMSDRSKLAVQYATKNAELNDLANIEIIQSDGFKEIEATDFTLILSNPPYHENFSVAKEFIESGFKHLELGGKMLMVTKRKEWYKNKLIAIFGGVNIEEIDGYYVFTAEKRSEKVIHKPKEKKTHSKKIARKLNKKS